MPTKRFLGIFLNPVYVQVEGLRRVFDNLEAVGAKAVCTVPNVIRPTEGAGGRRFPDLHVDGHARVLARPVWGQHEIRVQSFWAHRPDLSLYDGGPYKPPAEPLPAEVDASIPHAIIDEAKSRGMEVHLLFHPFLPAGLRPEDRPVRIDGSTPAPPQVALTACLNNPAATAYGLALAEDLVQHYRVDGLMPDWVEFGTYGLADHFTCFCAHCERKARQQALDWEAVRHDVAALWHWCHSLTPATLGRSRRVVANPSELLKLLSRYPGWLQFLRFKADSVAEFYRQVRQRLDALGREDVVLSARGWPPPWNRSSGMDYRTLSEVCRAVTPKLFTFDYCALPRWYGQTLLAWNPSLTESDILDALVEWMNLPDDIERRSFAHYHIPAPEEDHPARIESYRVRLDEVVAQVGGQARVYPFAHAYLPEPQWERMVALIRDSQVDGMWVQMYGYLSDRKLEILRNTWPRTFPEERR
jgi:hypothetical protein